METLTSKQLKAATSVIKKTLLDCGRSQQGGLKKCIERLKAHEVRQQRKKNLASEVSASVETSEMKSASPAFSPAPAPAPKSSSDDRADDRASVSADSPVAKRSKVAHATLSSMTDPLKITAKEYVEVHCDGDIANATSQYVLCAQGKIKLKIPDVRGSKSGQIIRWVNA